MAGDADFSLKSGVDGFEVLPAMGTLHCRTCYLFILLKSSAICVLILSNFDKSKPEKSAPNSQLWFITSFSQMYCVTLGKSPSDFRSLYSPIFF